jgi:hypothetical protein
VQKRPSPKKKKHLPPLKLSGMNFNEMGRRLAHAPPMVKHKSK